MKARPVRRRLRTIRDPIRRVHSNLRYTGRGLKIVENLLQFSPHLLRILYVMVSIALVLSIAFAVPFSMIWEWLKEAQGTETESNSTTIRNISFIFAGLIALALTYWRIRIADRVGKYERFQKGAEMLSNSDSAVRLAAILSLQNLGGRCRMRFEESIVRVLHEFVRSRSENKTSRCSEADSIYVECSNEIQTAMEAISSLVRNSWTITVRNTGGLKLDGILFGKLNLPRACLHLFSLSESALVGANLVRSYAVGVNFSSARLSGADLTGANLFRAILIDANLDGATLSGANLSGADLSGASLRNTDLSEVDLTGAVLSRATLLEADLSEASLSNADLSGAILSLPSDKAESSVGISGLTQSRLDRAISQRENAPRLGGEVRDPETGERLVWRRSG